MTGNEVRLLTGVMTAATGTSFASDKDSISDARLGERMEADELMLGVTGSLTAETKHKHSTT